MNTIANKIIHANKKHNIIANTKPNIVTDKAISINKRLKKPNKKVVKTKNLNAKRINSGVNFLSIY